MLKSKRIKPDKSKLKSSFEQYYSSSDHSCAGHVFSIFFKSRDFESFRYRILKIISKILPPCSFMLLNILWFDHKNIKKSILTQIHVPKHGFLKSWSSIVKIFFTRYFILYQSDNFWSFWKFIYGISNFIFIIIFCRIGCWRKTMDQNELLQKPKLGRCLERGYTLPPGTTFGHANYKQDGGTGMPWFSQLMHRLYSIAWESFDSL